MLSKPISVELYLIYRCPKCKCEWTKRPKEAKLLKGMICESCGYFIRFKPIETAKVKLTYRGSSSRPAVAKIAKVVKPAKSALTKVQEDAILAMKSLGFPVRQSKEFVLQHQFQSIEDYIQAAVREGTTSTP